MAQGKGLRRAGSEFQDPKGPRYCYGGYLPDHNNHSSYRDRPHSPLYRYLGGGVVGCFGRPRFSVSGCRLKRSEVCDARSGVHRAS